MDPDVIALFREVADRSAPERAAYYARHGVSPALRAEVESLLRFDRATLDAGEARVVAGAYAFLHEETRDAGALPAAPSPGADATPAAPMLIDGTVFGPYRIVRLLGRGGMGIVYEADEIESGRRVALKVLTPLAGAAERERFEREGRLAASVNHPNCVFVFGAGEVDGHPAIAMEIMQGTLADHLQARRPFSPKAAVDTVLQLIAGLQAACAAGILHRDIKPSNCFVDGHGTVKIGDFGISRSLVPTEETALTERGQRPATPAYASPEQLRGEPLDVRSDIYSLGAMLYELLTGRRPFERADLVPLLMAVANDAPAPPHALVPGVPEGLSHVILRCLAKRPERRFLDYPTLAAALDPYSSAAPTPATFGKRCLAGCIDLIPLVLLTMVLSLWWGGPSRLDAPLLVVVAALEFLYYVGFEISWNATPGKALCGLSIVGQEGGSPAWPNLVIRAAAFALIQSLPLQLLLLAVLPDALGFVGSGLSLAMLALIFSTARPQNGYAGVHDLLSNTRVVERRWQAARRTWPAGAREAPGSPIGRLGPFAVTSNAIVGMPEGWRTGFDDRLRRQVWIREVAPGTPQISLERAALNRPTRLRWIAGRRTANEAWDVFEAVPGFPLHRAVAERRTWKDVRRWLLDIARECYAQSPTDRPPRRLDRVWILDTGAKLVDDPALDADCRESGNASVASFLLDVGRTAREPFQEGVNGRTWTAPPWPLAAHGFLHALGAAPPPPPGVLISRLEALMRQPPSVTRGWRTMTLAIPLLVPVAWAITLLVYSLYARTAVASIPEDVRVAAALVRALDEDASRVPRLAEDDRVAIEVALATRYRERLTRADVDRDPMDRLKVTPRLRRLTQKRIRQRDGNASLASTPGNPTLQRLIAQADPPSPMPWHRQASYRLLSLLIGLLGVACFALINAWVWRGGVIRLLGLEFVTADGRRASRARVLTRTAAAWAPVLLVAPAIALAAWPPQADDSFRPRQTLGQLRESADISSSELAHHLGYAIGQRVGSAMRQATASPAAYWLMAPTLLVLLGGAIFAIIKPEQGIQDRLVGTWIVPR